MSNLVIVESPAKAKTINKYLGNDYKVLATVGHIRDLLNKDGSVRPDDDFEMDWEVHPNSQKQIKEIAAALKNANNLYLATDPDREGEGISWHLQEILREKNLLADVNVKRIVFNEITKKAVLDALEQPRDVDGNLVEAYLARRALDHLVGFKLSPVLWRKLPGNKSAGRVQSVALRLICEREIEIENFIPTEYWTVEAEFRNSANVCVLAKLTHLNGQKLDKFSLNDKAAANQAVEQIEKNNFAVSMVERKQTKNHPRAPFTTSTLQQAAAHKLYFTAKKTMQVAQSLYQGVNVNGETLGLITYMRTDGVSIAQEAIGSCRNQIKSQFGDNYLPKSPRIYKTKAKNAQEAHEAIRPTNFGIRPQELGSLNDDQRKLYELIWNKTVASQMESAVMDQVAIDLRPIGKPETFNDVTMRATGSVIAFDGHLRVYKDAPDKTNDNQADRVLPNMKEGEAVSRASVSPEQHFTNPPARFSEASLVKQMEELGIGRPSTYSSIISKLKENYVRLENRRFYPEGRSRLVTAFLVKFFSKYVEYDFTAELEEKLDDISGGHIEWKSVLQDFWTSFSEAINETSELRNREVLDALNELLGPHFFRTDEEGGDPRKCPNCKDGRLSFKSSHKHGGFIGCTNYPECNHTRPLTVANGLQPTPALTDNGPKELGIEPKTGFSVSLRRGPYGFYIQLGEPEGKIKPKRASLTKDMDPNDVDLKLALDLLALPREVGLHPETADMITAAIGRFGPYVKMGGTYVSLKEDNVLEIGLNRAVALLADAPRRPAPVEVGPHPKDKKPITLRQGRFGLYVQHGNVRATLPKENDKETIDLELAIELIEAKTAKKKTTTTKKASSKKRATKKKAVTAKTQH